MLRRTFFLSVPPRSTLHRFAPFCYLRVCAHISCVFLNHVLYILGRPREARLVPLGPRGVRRVRECAQARDPLVSIRCVGGYRGLNMQVGMGERLGMGTG